MYQLLIVDDEKEILNGLGNLFPWEDIGFEIAAEAQNGKEAFTILQTLPIDIVLCDIVMPVMNGLKLAELVKRDFPETKMVLLSGYKDFEYAKAALEYGVRNYIVKSTGYNDLIRAFSKIRQELDNEYPERSKPPQMNFNEQIIHTIKQYAQEHIADVTLEDLAQLIHMNPFYISKFFKQKTGQNFSEYLNDIRMKKARYLLDQIEYRVYEIGNLVGYSNSFNFSRAFKRYYGIPPSAYRKRVTVQGAKRETSL